MISRYLAPARATSSVSAAVSDPARPPAAVARFSSICVSSFMPESTTVTSGWSQTQRKAHSAGERGRSASCHSAATGAGRLAARHPPPHRPPPAQRLHDDHAKPLRRRIAQTCGTRLPLRIQVVVLDLAEFPRVTVHDARELVRGAVERESGVPNTPVGA